MQKEYVGFMMIFIINKPIVEYTFFDFTSIKQFYFQFRKDKIILKLITSQLI